MPPNRDVKQIQLGRAGIVTLVLVRDREMGEYRIGVHERGVVARRTEIALDAEQAREVARFITQPLHVRPIVTDNRVEIEDPAADDPGDDDPTKP